MRLKEILDLADVPKGSFYHYFKSKEDLDVAVIEESAATHGELIREHLSDRQKSPLKRVQNMFGAMRDHYVEHGPMREFVIAKLALEVAQLSEPMRLAIKYAYANWSAQVARALTEAKAAGEISDAQDPRRIGRISHQRVGRLHGSHADRSEHRRNQSIHRAYYENASRNLRAIFYLPAN